MKQISDGGSKPAFSIKKNLSMRNEFYNNMNWDWFTGMYYYFKKESRPNLKGKLIISISDANKDKSRPFQVTVNISGQICNKGYADGEGIVDLTIYDGVSSHKYEAPTGIIPAGKETMFTWSADFDYFDEKRKRFLYHIRTTKKTDYP